MLPHHEQENTAQASVEFSEIIQDLHHLGLAKEPFFNALFIDRKPYWRKHRFALICNQLQIKTYPHHIKQLRKTITSPQYQEAYMRLLQGNAEAQEKQLVEELHTQVTALFTSIELHKFNKALVHLMRKSGKAPNSSDLFTSLRNTRTSIENAPHAIRLPICSMIFQFLQGQFNIHYDPYLQENTPYRLFEYNSIPVLRMGTPTYESVFAPISEVAAITPEFRAFIQAYKLQNKKHLYINLQNRNPTWTGRNEAPRCKALESLGQEFPGTLTVITLAKNTTFYHQDGLYEDLDNAARFKEIFLEELFSVDSGFYFDQLPDLIASDKIFLSLLEKVHAVHFESHDLLSRKERLAFIELFYLELEKWCIESIRPDTLNISCKDGIDRAGGATALLYFDTYLRGQLLTSESISDLQTILLAPAILVKKRAITKNRFDRFIGAISYLQE